MRQLKKLRGGDVLVGDVYLPAASTIRAKCLAIQATWSEAETLERRAGPTGHVVWQVPHVEVVENQDF